MAQRLALSLHSKKGLSSNPPSGRGLFVWSSDVLLVFAWVPQLPPKDVQLVGIG